MSLEELLSPFPVEAKGGLINSHHLYRMLREALANPAFSSGLTDAPVPEDTNWSDRRDEEWSPPKASRADREMPLRNLKAFRTYSLNVLTNRECYGESLGETDLIDILTIQRDVVDIEEQVELEYVDQDGVVHSHFVDVVATRSDGRRDGYAYKDGSHRKSTDIDRIVEMVRMQNPDRLDSFEVRTRATVSHAEAANARVIIRARKLRAEADVARLLELLTLVHGWIELPKLANRFVEPARAFDAAVNLIDDGILIWAGDDHLTPSVFIRPVRAAS